MSTSDDVTLSVWPRAGAGSNPPKSTEPAWTLVGPLDSATPSRVDGAGLVTPHGAAWSVDWWIGADDRWYFPSREAAVRQHREGPGPVLRTSVRIPSGDAHQRVYGAVAGRGEVTVIEVENDSPVPVALGLAIRPYTVDGVADDGPVADGPVAGGSVDGLVGGAAPFDIRLSPPVVTVDGRPALGLPRPPNESAASATVDLADVIAEGGDLGWDRSATNALVLYPLPHRTTLRFVIPATRADEDPAFRVPDTASVPDPASVTRGWRSVVEGATRFEPPDNGLGELLGAARARLLLGGGDARCEALANLAPGAGAGMLALTYGGHRSELSALVDTVAAGFPRRLPNTAADAAAVVAALGPAHRLLAGADTVPPAPDLLEAAAQITHLVEKADRRSGGDRVASATARAGLADLARAAGDEDAARHLLSRARGDEADLAAPMTLDRVSALAEAASEGRSWGADSLASAAAFVIAMRQLLIDDDPGPHDEPGAGAEDGSAELRILPSYPAAWRGGNMEVHRAPTRHGELSYGIRWHGPRPALLWQLEPFDGPGRVRLRCPGLDPEWSTLDTRGETLLAGAADGLDSVPAPGDGFR